MTKDHQALIEAFRTLFKDQYFHDLCGVQAHCGTEDSFLTCEISTATGYDGKSLELHFKDAAVFPKDGYTQGADGDATAIIEGRGAYMIGCAMIGFALAAEDRGELL
jgi:hypothetical protein